MPWDDLFAEAAADFEQGNELRSERMIRLIGLSGLLMSIVPATGCINEPGALTLSLHPTKATFAPNEPIGIETTLAAARGPLCLSRAGASGRYRVTMQPLDAEAPLENGRLAYCGTNPTMLLLPLVPLIWIGAGLDVADVGGKFQLLKAGERCKQSLCITQSGGRVWTGDDRNSVVHPGPHEPWPAGRYRVTVRLDEQDPFVGPPIGWTLYKQPLTGDVEIEVVCKTEAQSTTALDLQ